MLKDLLPAPKKIDTYEGSIALKGAIFTEHAPFESLMATMSESTEKLFSITLENAHGGITMQYCQDLPTNLYIFDSTGSELVLKASSTEAMYYALATTLQVIIKNGDGLTVEKALIEDYPDKAYRALMVDLARQWHPAEKIHKYIDVCFMLKIRYLHLHFIDDQRYTLPSRAFPKLNSGKQFYSFEQIEAMRQYATSRGVTIIPEFEAPGHAKAMIRSYPELFANELSCESGNVEIKTEAGVVINAESIICAGSEKTSEAVGTLLREVCEMFPESPYVHIGGDEANIKVWDYCPVCQKYMQEHGIADIHELYSEFVGRTARMVLDLGKTPIVWEGFPKSGTHHIPKETIVVAWESYYHLAPDLLKAGFKIINASWQPLYIIPDYDLKWDGKDILNWNVYNWQHWWPKSVAKLNPITVEATENVIGAQICAWESLFEQEVNKVVENLSALSQQLWTTLRTMESEEFYTRLNNVGMRIMQLIQDV